MTTRADRTLALVAATLGFAGAVFLSSALLTGFRMAVPAMLLVVSTTIVAGGLGLVASRRVDSPVGFAGATLAAGSINGAILGMIAGMSIGHAAAVIFLLIGGAAIGVVCAMPFVPALTIAFKTTRRVGRARAGSLVDEADRRAPWTASCVTILTGGMALATAFPQARQPMLFALMFGAGLVTVILAIKTGSDWYRARGWQIAFADAEPGDDATVEVPAGAAIYDLGVGEDEQEIRERGDAYRAGVRTKARLKGNATVARTILRSDLALGIVGALLGVLVTVWLFRTPLAPDPYEQLDSYSYPYD